MDIQDNFETLKAYFDWQVVVDREDYNSLKLNYNSIYNEITRLQNTSRIEILALSNNENLIDEELESNNQLLNSKYDAFIQDLKSLDTSIKITHDDFKIALINDLDLLLSTTNNLTAEQIVSPFPGETDEDNIFNYFNNFKNFNDDMKLIMTDFYSRILGTSTNGLNIYDSI